MAAANRIRPLEIFQKHEWQILSARQSWRGPFYVFHAWFIIGASMTLFALLPNPITFFLAIMLTGSRQLGIAILMHEAAHGALHPNRRVNDFLGHWLCAAPVGASLSAYRRYHLNHHKYVQQPEDPDLGLSAHFPITKESLKRKIFRDLTGQTFLRQRLQGLALLNFKSLKTAQQPITDDHIEDARQQQSNILSNRKAFRDHALINILLLIALTLIGFWWLYPVVWLLALATWFPLVTRIRNIAEHACVPNTDDPLGHARTTHANWLERVFIAPYFVNYHSEHHAFMHLPCYRLPKAHKMLKERGYEDRIAQASSYRDVLTRTTLKKVR